MRERVRLLKLDEICYQRSSRFHLAGVEGVLSSMRECGHSLVFLVEGRPDRVTVYLGVSQFESEPRMSVDDAISVYEAAWRASFPGGVFGGVPDAEVCELSAAVGRAKHCGFLTGLPSLKREEKGHDFVQGLERLIRALRGRSYIWMSVADPISLAQLDQAVESCHRLTSDVHHLAKTGLSKSVSKGKTVMAGMFGMAGVGDTDGKAYSVTDSESKTHTDGTAQQYLEDHQRLGKLFNPATGALIGATIGSIVPGVGTLIGGLVGGAAASVLGPAISDLGDAITGKSGHSTSVTDSITTTRAFTNTASQAISRQIAGGGFGSLGMTWTRTTTITLELLNRKAEYCEELLRTHEQRLMAGRAAGMWTVGHYFCSEDPVAYEAGNGALRSLFTGMDSQYEQPRIAGLPEGATTLLRRFANIYLSFPNEQLRSLVPSAPTNRLVVASHPLGPCFNGVGTPLTTPELAITTPLPTQEAEGIGVSRRAAFGVNAPVDDATPSLTLGDVLDHGDPTRQKLRLKLANLPKHLGVFGLTGSGKTTTMQSLLRQLWEKHRKPFLVIEPAKAEYRRLAGAGGMKEDLAVITAGVESTSTCPLRLNPFSFSPPDDEGRHGVHLLTHIDRLRAIFNASFPMYASMPYLLEEALLEIYQDKGWDPTTSRNRHVGRQAPDLPDYFPTLGDLHLKIDSVVKRKGYWVEQERNLTAALKTRIASLMTGAKGTMLNCRRSVPDAALFERPMVVELRHLGDDDEKVFLMGLLVSRLYEYRECQPDDERQDLRHLLVIEEAHRLLADVPDAASSGESSNMRGKGVSSFIDMLSEVRAYGQGVAVVDQVPGRLHPYIVKGTGTKIVHRLLAKDDREMVGHTMGLDDDQMADLGLLDCGQCIFHQDGVRKAFLCRVTAPARAAVGGSPTTNAGTVRFREQHAGIIESGRPVAPGSDSPEAMMRLHDELHKAMTAAVFTPGKHLAGALTEVRELRPAKSGDIAPWRSMVRACWRQITDEVWGFHGGNFKALVGWHSEGETLLNTWFAEGNMAAKASAYQEAAAAYFRSVTGRPTPTRDAAVGAAYEQLIVRMEVVLAVAHRVTTEDPVTGEPASHPVGRAIAAQMRALLPGGSFRPPDDLVKGLAGVIAGRIDKRKSQRDELADIAISEFKHQKP